MDYLTLPAQIEPVGACHPDLPALPSPPEKIHWWLVTPSPMSFENIGVSNPTQSGLGHALILNLSSYILTIQRSLCSSLRVQSVTLGPWAGANLVEMSFGLRVNACGTGNDNVRCQTIDQHRQGWVMDPPKCTLLCCLTDTVASL